MSAIQAVKVQVEAQPSTFLHKPILFGTDFSPSAEAALTWLKTLAWQLHSRVLVTYFDRTDADDPDAQIPKASIQDRLSWTTEDIRRSGATVEAPGVCELKTDKPFVLRGLEARLKEITESSQASLLALGTRGYTGIKRFLFGSFSEMVFRHSDVPVLVVGPAAGKNPPTGAISKVLYATDFQIESVAALPVAVSFARDLGARLVLAHVNRTPWPLRMRESEILQRLLRMAEHHGIEDVQLVEIFGNPRREIVNYASENGIGTIVLGVRTEAAQDPLGLRFPDALATTIIAKASCPVLAYRGRYQAHATFFRASSGF